MVLDVDLDGERSWPIADVLVGRNVSFGFTTGFQAALILPERFSGAPVLSDEDVLDRVRGLRNQTPVGVI